MEKYCKFNGRLLANFSLVMTASLWVRGMSNVFSACLCVVDGVDENNNRLQKLLVFCKRLLFLSTLSTAHKHVEKTLGMSHLLLTYMELFPGISGWKDKYTNSFSWNDLASWSIFIVFKKISNLRHCRGKRHLQA